MLSCVIIVDFHWIASLRVSHTLSPWHTTISCDNAIIFMFVRRGRGSTLAPGGGGETPEALCVSWGIMSCVWHLSWEPSANQKPVIRSRDLLQPIRGQEWLSIDQSEAMVTPVCVQLCCARGLNCETSQPLLGLASDTHYIHYITGIYCGISEMNRGYWSREQLHLVTRYGCCLFCWF